MIHIHIPAKSHSYDPHKLSTVRLSNWSGRHTIDRQSEDTRAKKCWGQGDLPAA